MDGESLWLQLWKLKHSVGKNKNQPNQKSSVMWFFFKMERSIFLLVLQNARRLLCIFIVQTKNQPLLQVERVQEEPGITQGSLRCCFNLLFILLHPTPVLLPGKSNRRSLWAAVHGVARVGHDWATSLSLFTFMHWRRKWQPTPVFLPGEPQGRGSLVGCHLWGRTELDTTEAT